MDTEPLVTIALPVYNGVDTMGAVAKSVLSQDYENIELLISDNASTDGTGELAREIAAADLRVTYHRQPRNVGIINNFEWTKHNCGGAFLRWIGDDDEIRPEFVSRCVERFADDPRLLLVTTQLEYHTNQGELTSLPYNGGSLGSDDAVVRLRAIFDLMAGDYRLIDPLYGMVRVAAVRGIAHDRILRGDEVYAARLALAGPWDHVPEILGARRWTDPSADRLASMLEVPRWHMRVRALIAARHLLAAVDTVGLGPTDTWRARALVARFYLQRRWATIKRRGRRVRRELERLR